MKLTVNGRAVSATTGGTDFDPAKPAVIFLHGAGFDRTAWRLQTRWFAHHGRSVLAVDFPAHGWSDGPALENIAAMADWTAALIEAAGLKQAALVGHSMGALVAVETAARFPDKVRALGLCGVAAEMPVHPEMLESAKANTLKVQELMTFWGMGNALHKGGMVSPGLWLRRESLAVLSGNQPGVIHADLAACNVYKDALARAAAIKCPTVLVLGDGDLMTPAAKAKPLAAAIAGARTVVIPNCGTLHDRRAAGRDAGSAEVQCLIASLSITGSTSGIGAATARRLARDGYKVALHSRSSADVGKRMADELAGASYHQADLADEQATRDLVAVGAASSTGGSTCWSTMPASRSASRMPISRRRRRRSGGACSTST